MTHPESITAIPTRYAGHHFRSRLEARWAVFFNYAGIAWEYEPQGYQTSAGPYLPDFLLPDSGTWVEVKGSEQALDRHLMRTAARELPRMSPSHERGPQILILGPIPLPPPSIADLGWCGLEPTEDETIEPMRHGFGSYAKNRRPWVHDTQLVAPQHAGHWLTPTTSPTEIGIPDAYLAARSARFEHGQSGAT